MRHDGCNVQDKIARLIGPARAALDALAGGQITPEQVVDWLVFAELGRLIAGSRKSIADQEAARRMSIMLRSVLAEREIDEDKLLLLNRDYLRIAARVSRTPAAKLDGHIETLSIMARLKSPLLSWEQSREE